MAQNPETEKLLGNAPFTKLFLSGIGPEETDPNFVSLVGKLDQQIADHMGSSWRDQQVDQLLHEDASIEALNPLLIYQAEGRRNFITALLFIGFELGSPQFEVLRDDIFEILKRGNFVSTHVDEKHDSKRVGDFVDKVLRIGASFRDNQPVDQSEKPFDWRTIPPDIP